MKRIHLLAILVLLSAISGAQVIGVSTVGPTAVTLTAGEAKAYQEVAQTAGTISSWCWYLDTGTGATRVEFGLYNGATTPTTLLGAVTKTVGTVPGWLCSSFNQKPLIVSGLYWAGIVGIDGPVVVRESTTGTGAVFSSSITNFPTNWVVGTATTGSASEYALSQSSVALSWNPDPMTLVFGVWRDGVLLGATTGTVFTDTAPAPGVHSYFVTAFGVGGESGESAAVSVTVP